MVIYLRVNPYAAGGYFDKYKMMQKTWKLTETLANGYSSERTQWELSNEYQLDRVEVVFQKSLHPCALDESRLSIRRVNLFIPVAPCRDGSRIWGEGGVKFRWTSSASALAQCHIFGGGGGGGGVVDIDFLGVYFCKMGFCYVPRARRWSILSIHL